MLASPWFNRALTNEGWTESERNDKDSLFHITADDWDAEALLILFNIIHLQNRKVPRKVTLDQLTKIAVLIDYCECPEAVEIFSSMWIEDLLVNLPTPTEYCRSVTLWIWISWVFDLTDQFQKATLVVVQQCSEPMRTLGLPIPDSVSGNINSTRYDAIERIIKGWNP